MQANKELPLPPHSTITKNPMNTRNSICLVDEETGDILSVLQENVWLEDSRGLTQNNFDTSSAIRGGNWQSTGSTIKAQDLTVALAKLDKEIGVDRLSMNPRQASFTLESNRNSTIVDAGIDQQDPSEEEAAEKQKETPNFRSESDSKLAVDQPQAYRDVLLSFFQRPGGSVFTLRPVQEKDLGNITPVSSNLLSYLTTPIDACWNGIKTLFSADFWADAAIPRKGTLLYYDEVGISRRMYMGRQGMF